MAKGKKKAVVKLDAGILEMATDLRAIGLMSEKSYRKIAARSGACAAGCHPTAQNG